MPVLTFLFIIPLVSLLHVIDDLARDKSRVYPLAGDSFIKRRQILFNDVSPLFKSREMWHHATKEGE